MSKFSEHTLVLLQVSLEQSIEAVFVVFTLSVIEKGRVWVIVDLVWMRAVAKVVEVFSAAFFDCLNLLL